MNMRKIASLVLTVAMLLSCFTMFASAASSDTGDLVIDTVNAEPGDTGVVVNVVVANNPGLYSFTFTPEYDTTRLTLTGTQVNLDGLGGSQTLGKRIVWLGDDADSYFNGTIVTFTFDVLPDAPVGEAAVSVTWNEGDICNYDEEDRYFNLTAGKVVVGGEDEPTGGATVPELVWPAGCAVGVQSVAAKAGDTVEVEVLINNNPGIYSFTFTPVYDTTRLALTSTQVNLDGLGGSQTLGKRIVWLGDDEDSTFNGTIITFTFDVLADAADGNAEVTLTYNMGDICNYDEEDVIPEIIPGYVVIGNGEGGEVACQHPSKTVTTVDPTCTTAGSETHTCDKCGEVLYTGEIAALGHTASAAVKENQKAPTCDVAGSYESVVYCSVCKAEMSRKTVTVDALGHDYDEDVTAPTCTANGYTTYTCSVCGDTYVGNTVAALGHTAGKTVVENAVAADCVNDGKYDNVVYCTVCKAEMSRETITVDALGHTAADAVVENASEGTCTAGGTYDLVVYCAVCGAELDRETVTVEAQGHTYVETVETVVAATCGTDGYSVKTVACSVCGDVVSAVKVYVPATGVHTPDADATCTTAQTCTDCGKVLVAAKGHTAAEAVREDVVEATCTSSGSYKKAVYCADCGTLMSRQLVYVAPLAHTPGAEATCTDDQICTVCEKVLVAAKGHVAGEAVQEDVVEATCGKSGSYKKAVYCTECDTRLSRVSVYVAPTGEHTPGAEATCTTAQTCVDCHKVLVAAHGHTHGEAQYQTIVEATETTSGSMYKSVYCTECGERIYRQLVYVAPLGKKED